MHMSSSSSSSRSSSGKKKEETETTAIELIEDELRNEMSQISMKAEEGTELLTNLQTALKNIRKAGKKDGWGKYNTNNTSKHKVSKVAKKKMRTSSSSSSAPTSAIKSKRELIEQLRMEKHTLENQRTASMLLWLRF